MTPDDRPIDDLAQAVLDGTSVDWAVAESKGGATGRLARHLKVVAAVSEASREAVSTGATEERSSLASLETWGHLRLIERIGRGAFGDVYRAWDTRLDREVALKLIPVGSSPALRAPDPESPETASEMLREGRLLARVRHPNVVTIHGADQIGPYIGVWMELVRGHSLEELLRESQAFEPEEVTRIGIELARALSAVQAAGILHRDIKAQNVVRADEGRIVLMDFGTGRDFAAEGSDLSGTPLYLAPEVFQRQPATPQSDIYSLGVLLYRLLTRKYPVPGRTIREVLDAHSANVRTDLRSVRPDVPLRLAQVIDRAIAHQPAARYSTADALGAALEKCASSPRRWPWYAAAAAVVLALGAAWLAGRTAIAPAVQIATPIVLSASERTVLAVRFENLLNTPGDEGIVSGFTYELVRRLGAMGGAGGRFVVLSADDTTSRADSKAFAGLLGASFVLDGSVSRASGRLHVDARLISAADGDAKRTWSFGNGNLLVVQGDILKNVANTFGLQFSMGRYRTSETVYNQFLRARSLQARSNPDNYAGAAALFWDAYEQDSSFTPALAAWASASFYRYMMGGTQLPAVVDPKVQAAAREVALIADDLAEAHVAMGWLFVLQREWTKAQASFKKAIELDPLLTSTYTDFYVSTLLPIDDVAEALRVMQAAYVENPRSLDVRRGLAAAQLDAGLFGEAIKNLEWVRKQDSEFPFVDMYLGRALFFAGRHDAALKVLEGNREGLWQYVGYVYAQTGREDEARKLIAERPGQPGRKMLVYAGLGEIDQAVGALEDMEKGNWLRAAAWLNKPEMKDVRESGDPRVAAFRERLRLPPP